MTYIKCPDTIERVIYQWRINMKSMQRERESLKIRFIEPGNRPYKSSPLNAFVYDRYVRTPSLGLNTLATIVQREYQDTFMYSESISKIRMDDVLDADVICIGFFTFAAVGHGVAIPHGRIKGLKAPMAAVFQLAGPIGFDAPDEQPVSLLIFLLVPEAATQQHLEVLSEIAELLSNSTLRESLKSTTDAADLHALIANWQPSAAASAT